MEEKRCSRCRKLFSANLKFFFRNKLSKDGMTPECKKCNYQKTKSWRERNKEHFLEISRKLGRKYRKFGNLLEKNRKWKLQNPEKVKKSRYEWYYKLKKEVFTHYSKGNIKCACCGIEGLEFMSLDHIQGNGREHRLEIAKERKWKTNSKSIGGGIATWRWLKKNNYPLGFQILCYNCNMAKRKNKICPHKSKKSVERKVID